MINLTQYGAVGDGSFMNTGAFTKAIEAAIKAGDTILVPSGTFLTGTINLKGVSLVLEEGATIKASGNLADYPYQNYYHNEMGQLRALLVNLECDNVSISGAGCIDLSGREFYDTSTYNVPDSLVPFTPEQVKECTYPIGERPAQCIFFNKSKNIRIEGIKIIDSPCWTMTFSECENVFLENLTIDTDLNIPNDDGIHISASKNVYISNCDISSGDDCIAVSSITNWDAPSENIFISNCRLRSCSKAIVLGYIYSKVRNVFISNCEIRESNRGFCIMCNDTFGLVENVEVNDLKIDTRIRAGNWWGNGEPIFIMALRHDEILPQTQQKAGKAGVAVRNVHFRNIEITAENAVGVVGNNNIEDVTFDNVSYTRKPSANIKLKGYAFDTSPSLIKVEVPEKEEFFFNGADVVHK